MSVLLGTPIMVNGEGSRRIDLSHLRGRFYGLPLYLPEGDTDGSYTDEVVLWLGDVEHDTFKVYMLARKDDLDDSGHWFDVRWIRADEIRLATEDEVHHVFSYMLKFIEDNWSGDSPPPF